MEPNRSQDAVEHSDMKGFLYALIGALLVSTNYVTAKYGLQGFNPETFSLVWTTAASIYTFIIVLLTGHGHDLKVPRSSVKHIVVLGISTGAGMILAWAGLALLDPSFASFIWRFAPVLTIVLSAIILNERLQLRELFPVALMVAGGALSTYGRWHIVGTGVILTLLAACTVAVQMVTVKMKVSEISPHVLVFYRVSGAAICIAIWSILTGRLNFNVATPHWVITLIGAFLGPSLSFQFTFRSYTYWDLTRSSIVLTAQPLIVLPLAYLAFGRIPTGLQLLGGFIIVAGAFWLTLLHRTRQLAVPTVGRELSP